MSGATSNLWTFYDPDCRFPVLERFDLEPTWENYRAFMTRFIDAFPDIHHHIEKVVVDGENVWALYTMTGTHRGPLRGIDASHRGCVVNEGPACLMCP